MKVGALVWLAALALAAAALLGAAPAARAIRVVPVMTDGAVGPGAVADDDAVVSASESSGVDADAANAAEDRANSLLKDASSSSSGGDDDEPSESSSGTNLEPQWQTPKYRRNEALNADGTPNKEGAYRLAYCKAQAEKRKRCLEAQNGESECNKRHGGPTKCGEEDQSGGDSDSGSSCEESCSSASDECEDSCQDSCQDSCSGSTSDGAADCATSCEASCSNSCQSSQDACEESCSGSDSDDDESSS